MKATTNNIHFARASYAARPSAQEIEEALNRANKNKTTEKGRIKPLTIYTR